MSEVRKGRELPDTPARDRNVKKVPRSSEGIVRTGLETAAGWSAEWFCGPGVCPQTALTGKLSTQG